MSEQRFDILVQDKVAKSIKTEVTAIGQAAKSANTDVKALRAALGGLSTEQAKSASASARIEAAQAKVALAQAKVATETAKTTAALAQAEAAQNRSAAAAQRLTTETARTAAAESVAAAAYIKAEAALERAAAASSRVVNESAAVAREAATAQRAMEREAAAADKLAASYRDAAQAALAQQKASNFLTGARGVNGTSGTAGGLSGKSAQGSAGVFQDAFDAEDAAKANKLLESVGKNADLARHHLVNLGFQLQDVFVSLASGQKPLTVFIQQGTQIGGIASQAGVGLGALARAAAGMLVPFIPLVALLGVAVGAFALFNRAINQDADMKKFVAGLGLTHKELKKLDDQTVTFGDTAKAVFQVGFERIAAQLGINGADIKKTWNSVLDTMWKYTKIYLQLIYASFAGTFQAIHNITDSLAKGQFQPLADIQKAYKDTYTDAGKFIDDVGKRAEKNAKDRLKAQADAIKADRTPHKAAKGFDRAKELADENAQLDAQIKLLQYYGSALEANTKLEEIDRKFREHGVALTKDERSALMAKIKTIQDGQKVQAEMTRIDEDVNGAQRKYNDTLEAANNLLEQGAISHQQYLAVLKMAERGFEDATNPLAAMNRELKKQGELVGKYGKNRDLEAYIQQLKEAAALKGESIYQGSSSFDEQNGIGVNGSKKFTPQAQGMVDTYKQQQQQDEYTQAFSAIDPKENQDVGGTAYILDNYKKMYEQINEWRDNDLISEQDAADKKKNLDQAYNDARLQTTSDVLGKLSTLQNAKSKEVRAIGKAAAIAQATIDGIAAVQAALRGPPGPPWSFAIAAATGVATAANVAKIAGIGFQQGGYTGNMGTSQVAGAVHGQEYVMDAETTKRIGVPALDALRRGTMLNRAPSGSVGSGSSPTINIRPEPGVYVEESKTSDSEIELVARRVLKREGPKTIADDIRSSPNSRTSTSMRQNFQIKRAR